MKINKISLLGIILLSIGAMLFLSDFLDPFITTFTHIFLMGSSEGKDILFFTLMGSMLILSPLFTQNGYLRVKLSKISYFENWTKNDFLKVVIILVISTYILGIILELWLRLQLGVSIFTTFVSLVPSPTSSSILHSHVFKAVLSPFIQSLVTVPSQIHTGSSLMDYVPPIGLIVLIILPLIYILGLFSLGDRRDYHQVILIFALATSMIGIIDGGLLSTPALVGLSGILGMYSLKMPFSFRNLINPAIIIALLIILRVILGLMGSNADYYEVTIIGASESVDINGYHILSYEKDNETIVIQISPQYNEMILLNDLSKSLEGKCQGFFISWNFFSFFGPTSTDY